MKILTNGQEHTYRSDKFCNYLIISRNRVFFRPASKILYFFKFWLFFESVSRINLSNTDRISKRLSLIVFERIEKKTATMREFEAKRGENLARTVLTGRLNSAAKTQPKRRKTQSSVRVQKSTFIPIVRIE